MAAARPVRIHLPWTAVIVPALLAVCVMPMASAGGWWSVVYALPIALLLVLALAGTTATGSRLSARWWRGWTRLAWDDVLQLEFRGQRWAVAVTQTGRRVMLPGVRPADLPRIVAAAGGRLFVRRPAAENPGSGEREDHGGDEADRPTADTADHGGDEADQPTADTAAHSGDRV